MGINKKTPSGVTYSINNGAATFRLDVARPDKHSKQIFTNYAHALSYCREQGLPTIPSVQLIQGKLKTFDEALCITLELAIEERRLKVLKNLLAALQREGNPDAVVHVATALSLAGADPKVEGETLSRVVASREAFLRKPEARPCGYWDTDERLRRNYQSGRYLMQGIRVIDFPETCIVISKVLMGDPALKAAFENVQAFDAKLTNPLKSTSFEKLSTLTPQEVRTGFQGDARFSLFGYSTSKEEVILDAISRKREIRSNEQLMPLLINAIRNGEFSLEPKPDSGWYDYQWHALETLLLPEKGRESAKLQLSKAYQKRLENAFASLLTKERETHLKRLPITALGCMSGAEMESPQKVRIAPEFSAEPTLTVYLRLARSYRFLRHALQATLGEEAWSRLRFSSGSPLDKELNQTMLFCYGLYEKLSLEIGQRPVYLLGEVDGLELEEARAVFERWYKGWQEDPSLLADTRVAVPVADRLSHYTYWGTAGVRLEPVAYKYLDKPDVSGNVEPEFVTCQMYLPTDFFFEFSRPRQTSLTRAEFRTLCDKGQSVHSLYKAFGVTPPSEARGTWLATRNWISAHWGWLAVLAVALLFLRLRRARLWLGLGLLAIVVGWGILLVCSPYYRTLFIVRYVATINEPMGLCSENRLLPEIEAASRLKALSTLLVDSNSKMRYLAARFMDCNTLQEDKIWNQIGIKERLMQATNDPESETAVLAVLGLRHYHDKETVDYLIKKMTNSKNNDELCFTLLNVLGEIKDPRAIKVIRPLCEDSRRVICLRAITTLGEFSKKDAMATLMELAESRLSEVRMFAVSTIRREASRWEGKGLSEVELNRKYDELFLERIKEHGLSFEAQQAFSYRIKDETLQLEARAFTLQEANSLEQTNGVLRAVATRTDLKQLKGKQEWACFDGIVTNSPVRLDLAEAIIRKDPVAVKQTLIKMMTQASSDADPETRALAERLSLALQEELKATERKRSRPRVQNK
jgi:HEAT repeat protein